MSDFSSAFYAQSLRALRWHQKELARVAALGSDALYKEWRRGTDVSCAVCRRQQRSAKSWSRDASICLSCSMRDNVPRKVRIRPGLRSWRKAARVTQRRFAAVCGWSQPRQSQLEKQKFCHPSVACTIARAVMRLSEEGFDFTLAAQQWPLMMLFLDEQRIKE